MTMKFMQLATSLKDPAIQARYRLTMPNQDYPFQCLAESVEFSTRNVPAKQRFAQAQQFSFPDASTLEGMTVVFYETYDFSVSGYLNKWDAQVRDRNGVYGMPRDYQRSIIIDFLNYEDDSVIKTFEYTGCWPTETAAFSVNYDDPNGRLQLTQTFAVRDLI